MLLYLGSFQVPEAPGITVFPDHEDPTKFYCIREVPKISTDAATNDPMLYYTSIKRDARVTESNIVNLGFMTLTVDIGPTGEETEAIRNYILGNCEKNIPVFNLLRLLFPNFVQAVKNSAVKIGSISWKDGKAQLELMEGMQENFKSYGTTEITPSLFGGCHASFSETFGAEGDLLMRSLLKMEGGDTDRADNMGALVRYTLNGYGYIPALKVTVKVNTDKLYNYFTENGNKHTVEKEVKEMPEPVRYKKAGGRLRPVPTPRRGKIATTKMTIADIESHMQTIATELSGTIDVIIDDFSGMVGQEVNEWANDVVMGYISAITQTVLPSLFTPVEMDVPTDESSESEGESEENKNKDKGPYYLLRTDYHTTQHQDITLTFTKSCTIPMTLAPQGTLMLSGFTPEQKKNLCREVDIADDTFQGLSVTVEVSANFQEDNIYSVEVDVLYQHMNAVTGKERVVSNTYKFKGGEIYMFRATKVKNEKGKYYDDYKFRSRILFKNQNEYFGGGDGWSDWQTLSEQVLTISYGNIGFLRTEVSPVNFDSDVIKEAIVHFKYLGANQSDTQGDVRLTPDGGKKSWRCFKYRSTSDKYQYSVKIIYCDGTVYESEPVTTNAGSITIEDPFVKPIAADFYVKMGSSISNVKVEVSFTDGKYEKRSNHSFTAADAMDPWHWTIKVRKDAKETMKYRYIAFYNSETDPYTSQWISASAKDETIYIKAEADPNAKPEAVKQEAQLTIDSSMLSWDKWKRVYVILKDDSGKTRTLPLNAEEPITTVDVTYSSDGKNVCQCSCQFLPVEGAVIKTPVVECQDLFIIEEP